MPLLLFDAENTKSPIPTPEPFQTCSSGASLKQTQRISPLIPPIPPISRFSETIFVNVIAAISNVSPRVKWISLSLKSSRITVGLLVAVNQPCGLACRVPWLSLGPWVPLCYEPSERCRELVLGSSIILKLGLSDVPH